MRARSSMATHIILLCNSKSQTKRLFKKIIQHSLTCPSNVDVQKCVTIIDVCRCILQENIFIGQLGATSV